jgi:dolichol-phosphate mannosyltransferase
MGFGWHTLSRLVLGYDAKDVDCGMKVFHRDAAADLEPRLTGDYATISPEILTWAKKLGHDIAELSVRHAPRENGEQSGANLKVIIGSIHGLFRLRRMLRKVA